MARGVDPLDIPVQQLEKRLESIKSRCFLVHGAETLLVDEARDRIRAHFENLGYRDVSRFSVETGFDWSALDASTRSLSLFGDKRYIELRMPAGQPGEKGAAFFDEFLAGRDNDTVLVILCGKLDKKVLSSAWCKAVSEAGAVVDTGSVPSGRLPQWITRRFQSLGVNCSAQVADRLAYFVEGNLLAADQEVRKLALILPPGAELDEARLETVMADHARFTVFALVDACVAGQSARGLRILRSLRQEGAEPFTMIWALARELRNLGLIGAALKEGQPRRDVFRRYRVWASREPMVLSALKRLGLSRIMRLQSRMCYLDQLVKGHQTAVTGPSDTWIEIEGVALSMCGINSLISKK